MLVRATPRCPAPSAKDPEKLCARIVDEEQAEKEIDISKPQSDFEMPPLLPASSSDAFFEASGVPSPLRPPAVLPPLDLAEDLADVYANRLCGSRFLPSRNCGRWCALQSSLTLLSWCLRGLDSASESNLPPALAEDLAYGHVGLDFRLSGSRFLPSRNGVRRCAF